MSSATGRATADGLQRLVLAGALIVVLPYVVISGGPHVDRGRAWILCMAIAMWAGFRLAELVVRREPRLYEFMFWLFTYIFMGLAPASQLYSNQMPSTTSNLDRAHDLTTALVVAVGVIAFEVGRTLRNLRIVRHHDQADPELPALDGGQDRDEAGSSFRAMLLFWGTMPISLYLVKKIGVGTLFVSRLQRDAITANALPDRSIGAIITSLAWVPALVTVHRLGRRRRQLREQGSRLSLTEVVTLSSAVAVVLLIDNPISGARYVFGSMALSLLVLFGGISTPKRVGRTLLGLVVAFFIVFPVADAFRRTGSPNFSLSIVNEYRGNGDYDAWSQVHNAVTVVHQDGLQLLRQPIGVALFWVPRSVWPNKPEDTGILLAQLRGYTFTNLSAPLWSEFYLIGGTLTVVLGFVAVGWVLGKADDRLVRKFELGRPSTVIASFMPFYLAILLRGSLLQATALAATFLVSVQLTAARAVTSTPIQLPTGPPPGHRAKQSA